MAQASASASSTSGIQSTSNFQVGGGPGLAGWLALAVVALIGLAIWKKGKK